MTSLLHQLRARESLATGFGSLGGTPVVASAASTTAAAASDGVLPSPASVCASALRTLKSHRQHILLNHTGCVNAVAISDSATDGGRWVASAGDDTRVVLWEAYAPLRAVYPLHARAVHEPQQVDSAAAGPSVRASAYAPSARPYPCAGMIHRGPTRTYSGHRANVFGLTFLPDSRRLLSCGLDAQILLYDLDYSGGKQNDDPGPLPPLRRFTGHQSSVHRLSLVSGSGGNVFLSASNDHTCRLFDIRVDSSKAQHVGGFNYSLNSVHTNPADPTQFVTAGEKLCLHDIRRMTSTNPPPRRSRASSGPARAGGSGARSARSRAREALAMLTGSQVGGNDDDEDEDEEKDASGGGAGSAGGGGGGAGAGGSGGQSDEDEDEDDDDGGSFSAMLQYMLSGASSHRAPAMAVLHEFDISLPTPRTHPRSRRGSSATAAAPTRRSARVKAMEDAASGSSSRGRGRGGRGAARGSSSRRGASRARGTRAGAAASLQAGAAPEAARSSSRGRGARGSGAGGRGRGSSGGGSGTAASSSRTTRRRQQREEGEDDEDDSDDAEGEPTEAERRELEASDRPSRRRSGRLQQQRGSAGGREEGDDEKEAEMKESDADSNDDDDDDAPDGIDVEDALELARQFGIEIVDDSEDEGEEDEEMGRETFPSPSERRRARYEEAQPSREASSCEFTADGKQVLCCIMKSFPLLFENSSRRAPVVALQSAGRFGGYSNTCTLKSAVYAGPDERFMLAGSDNFGLYLWDRTLPASDVLSSPSAEDAESKPVFLNAFKIIRGHRSIPNNMRFHPELMQIYSCGVEKVVRVFHCTVPADVISSAAIPTAFGPLADERDEEQMAEGDVLNETETRHLLQRHHLLPPGSPVEDGNDDGGATAAAAAAACAAAASAPATSAISPASSTTSVGSKRKTRDDGKEDTDDTDSHGEKKAKSDADAVAEQKEQQDVAMSAASPATDATTASPAAALPSATATPSAPASGTRRRSARTSSATAQPAGGASSAAPSTRSRAAAAAAAGGAAASSAPSRPSSPPLDPLYRMVRTYMRPRLPYTRMQCAFLLSGGASAFGLARQLFEDVDPDEVAELEAEGGAAPANGEDDMGEDRQCMAQFDFYVAKTAAGESVSDFEDDDDDDDDDEDEDEGEGNSSD